jgi:hypothetical protein
MRAASVLGLLERWRFALLFGCLLTLFVLHPVLLPGPGGEPPLELDAALSMVLLAALWSLDWRRSAILVALVVMAATLAVIWIANVAPSRPAILLALSCGLAILGFTAGSLLGHVVRKREVRADTILGGLCVYLLLACAWAMIYALLETLHPGSLISSIGAQLGAEQRGTLLVPDLLYYSVDVLTTIGPQDVHGVSNAARVWTGLEAMAGQLFLVIFISRMVGLHGAAGRSQK